MNLEMIIMQLITNGGEARSNSMEAIHQAKLGNIEGARVLIEEANSKISLAHKGQTQLIHSEAKGEGEAPTLLLVHAQDHLMNAITVRDMAVEMVDLYEIIMERLK